MKKLNYKSVDQNLYQKRVYSEKPFNRIRNNYKRNKNQNMKLTVKMPEKVIWSSETREVTLNDGERDILVRYYDSDNDCELYIRINDGKLLKSDDVDDVELVELAEKIRRAFGVSEFENVGDVIDVEDLEGYY
jgi:biotin-(acetyl-CoA carboxylase) ligase